MSILAHPLKLLIPPLLLLLTFNVQAQKSGTIKIQEEPEPDIGIVAKVAGKSGGLITKKQLLSASKILVNDSTKVIFYDFQLTRASIRTKFTVEGNDLGPEIKRYFEELRPNQIIQFKEIMCRDKHGLQFRVQDIQFKIVEFGTRPGIWSY